MPLLQLIKIAISDSKRTIAAIAINAALLILVYNLHIHDMVVIYPIVLTLAVLVVYLSAKVLSLARLYKQLDAAKISPVQDVYESTVPKHIFETVNHIHDKHLNEIYRLRRQMETRNSQFSQFIHGMKSSVAVIELACEAPAPIVVSDIVAENEKLKKALEQALNLLRLDAFTNDYVPEKLELADLVNQVVNDHKRDFIYAGVFPKLSGSATVFSDPKWCGYVISQIVSNAIKYSHKCGEITLEITGQTLRITDSGIGIPPEDMPRIFDMFYTGANGRRRKESTGIGLFMAKHIADKLGIGLGIESEVEQGTVVILTFADNRLG